MNTTLVYGVGVAGQATVAALVSAGRRVAVTDDTLDVVIEGATTRGPNDAGLFDDVDVLVPAPGVAESHPVLGRARQRGIEVLSEIEVAYRLETDRVGGPRPMLAVTGTDGKTTTTLMAAAILNAAGLRAEAAGNSGTPLCSAILGDAEAFVVECSSFALARVHRFRAAAAAWLNLSPDHLDWHTDMSSYERAKANLWRAARADDVAVCSSRDERIHAHASASAARVVTAGSPDDDWGPRDGYICGPAGPLVAVSALSRRLPHDAANASVAAALCVESGLAEPAAVAEALPRFEHPPHRIALVAEHDGVRYFDDSKATTPHAALTAIRGFDRVVLVAGGRNKGLDLTPLAAEADRIVGVVAMGEAAGEVEAVFAGIKRVERAASMREAVSIATAMARAGDVVLLSPACASFDWYRDYARRGDDFATEVRTLVEQTGAKGETR